MRALLFAFALALAACATPTPYQAAVGERGYGYVEQAIEANRLRLSFRGNSLTDRQVVEDYLLYRAAELALARGADHFILVERAVDENTRTVGDLPPRRAGFHHAYFSPYYGWSPFYDPFWTDITLREVTRYEASAEVVFGSGPKPSDNPNAYDARDVSATLGPRVTRPPQP
jgi:hypothetical protein